MESEPFHLQLVQNAKTTLLVILVLINFKGKKAYTSYSLFSSRNTVHFLKKNGEIERVAPADC
jgi:hypothetical protein